MFLRKSISTKDIFDRLEFSNIANIVVNGEGKVFYRVLAEAGVAASPTGAVSAEAGYVTAMAYGAVGEYDLAFAALEQAYERRHPLLNQFKVDPRMDSLRDDPRFDELVARMNYR